MTKSSMFQRGFTITELLVVVSILSILAGGIVVAYKGVRTRARADVLTAEIKNVAEALDLYAQKSNWVVWPLDTDTKITNSGTADPLLTMMIADKPIFRNYLPAIPKIDGLPALQWRYDNNDDIHDPAVCNVSLTNGVNIWVEQLGDVKVAQIVDTNLDDGDVNCGMIRYNPGVAGGRLLYGISKNPTIQ